MDATEAGAGLGTDGTYTANSSANYISTSTSIVDATEDLDAQVKTNADALSLKASLASPTFTGIPTLPTGTIGVNQTAGNSSTAIATTAFVGDAVSTAKSAAIADAINDGTTTIAPSQNAVFDALALKENAVNISTNLVTDGASDTKYPSVKSVKTYVDNAISASAGVSGTGPTNYIPKFSSASALTNSSIYDDGTKVGIGTASPSSYFQIGGESSSDFNLKFDRISNTSSALKLGFRAYQWRIKTQQNSGTLDPLVFSYFNGTNDVERFSITNLGINVPNNLTVLGSITGENANLNGTLSVNNLLSINTTTRKIGLFTGVPTSLFQIGGDGNFDNPLKYDFGDSEGTLKFGFRSNEFRMKTNTNSGVLENLIFSYFNNATSTDVESMRIINNGTVSIRTLRITSGAPSVGKVLTSDVSGNASWATPTTTATSYSGVLPVANGGTGAATLTGYIKGNGTSTMTASATIPIADVAGAAPLASPTFTGTPTLPTGTIGVTQKVGNSSTAIATTAFVGDAVSTATSAAVADAINDGTATIAPSQNAVFDALALKANLASPSFSGTVTTPALVAGTNTYPTVNGSVNQVLTTNGSGILAWSTPSIGATDVNSLSDGLVEFNSIYIGNDPSATSASSAQYNVAVGTTALDAITSGSQNVALGSNALTNNTGGSSNTAIGASALLSNITGIYNTAIGYWSLLSATTGGYNTAVGPLALANLSIGEENTAFGFYTLRSTTGSYNTGFGTYALNKNISGSYNTALGKGAGRYIAGGTSDNSSGSNNVFLGAMSKSLGSNDTNEIVIGYDAIGAGSNTVTLGNSSITAVNTSGAITADSFIKSGGTATQFLMADGSVSAGAAAVREVADEFTAATSQTSFTLTQTPSVNSKVKMYINGIRISNTAYSVTGATLTYAAANNGGYALTASDRVQFDYYY